MVYFTSIHICSPVYREFYEKYQVAGEKEAVISLYEEETQPTVCERYIVLYSNRSGLSWLSCIYVGLFMSSR